MSHRGWNDPERGPNADANASHGAERMAALLAGFSVEISSRRDEDVEDCRRYLPPGTEVSITAIPGDGPARSVAVAAVLRRAGLEPVPHISARTYTSVGELDAHIRRLREEADVERVLLIGGDARRPAGPFASSLDLLATGILASRGIRRVGLAGYPEGHPQIADAALQHALAEKLRVAAEQALACRVVTQFCFTFEPIRQWLVDFRRRGLQAPVRIGVAGPTSIPTLIRFALRCGVGNSIHVLTAQRGRLARVARPHSPDALLHQLVALARERDLGLDGVHFFTFGGVTRTAQWAAAAPAGEYTDKGTKHGLDIGG